MTTDFKHWNLLNYDYICTNHRKLSTEARLLFSATPNIEYTGSFRINNPVNERSYFAPNLKVNATELIDEIARSNFVTRHTVFGGRQISSPLFVYFAIAQVLFDRLIDLLTTLHNVEFFETMQQRCLQSYLLLYVQCHFKNFSEPPHGEGYVMSLSNAIPIVFINQCTPMVHILIDPYTDNPKIFDKLNAEIDFDLRVAKHYSSMTPLLNPH